MMTFLLVSRIVVRVMVFMGQLVAKSAVLAARWLTILGVHLDVLNWMSSVDFRTALELLNEAYHASHQVCVDLDNWNAMDVGLSV